MTCDRYTSSQPLFHQALVGLHTEQKMADNFTRHESKGNVQPTPKTVIVEAYGLKKCTRLVEQVRI